MSDFSTGKPPKRRVILYGLVVWAIIFLSAYPQLGEMHQYKYLFWIFIPIPGLFIIYFGFVHEKLKTNKTTAAWMAKYGPVFGLIVFMLLILSGLLKFLEIIHSR